MNLQQREAARLAVGGTKSTLIRKMLSISDSTWRRWRGENEFTQYVRTLEAEREKQEIERGMNRRDTGEVHVPDGLSVDEQIRAISQEAVVVLRKLVHDEDPRVSLSASLQALNLAGHVAPARKPSVQPNDAAARRGSSLARLSAAVDDECRESMTSANVPAESTQEDAALD